MKNGYMETLHDPCQFCGNTWHKHTLDCPDYSSIAPERCKIEHTPFLRSISPKRPPAEKYEYECALCNLVAVFTTERKERDHPLCAEGKHYIVPGCGDGCCPPRCNGCGKLESSL